MALLTTDGRYVKALGYDYSRNVVHAMMFRDKDQRAHWPDNLDRFDQVVLEVSPLLAGPSGLDQMADSGKTILENVLAVCYASLKADQKFKGAVDA